MTEREFADLIISLPAEKQEAFFETLKSQLSADDWLATVKFISIWRMYHSPAKYNALKAAVCDVLCEEFFGHPYEAPANKGFDPCNPVYMTTIL